MAARIIQSASDYATLYRLGDGLVRSHVDTNPGIVWDSLKTFNTDYSPTDVRAILDVLIALGLIVVRYDFSGVGHYYTSRDWYTTITGEYQNARLWLRDPDTDHTDHSDLSESVMATELNLAEEVVVALVDALTGAGEAKTKVSTS